MHGKSEFQSQQPPKHLKKNTGPQCEFSMNAFTQKAPISDPPRLAGPRDRESSSPAADFPRPQGVYTFNIFGLSEPLLKVGNIFAQNSRNIRNSQTGDYSTHFRGLGIGVQKVKVCPKPQRLKCAYPAAKLQSNVGTQPQGSDIVCLSTLGCQCLV